MLRLLGPAEKPKAGQPAPLQCSDQKGWVRMLAGAYATTPVEAPVEEQIDAIRQGDHDKRGQRHH